MPPNWSAVRRALDLVLELDIRFEKGDQRKDGSLEESPDKIWKLQ